jgi:hypothetical protein
LGRTPLPATISPRGTVTVNLAQTYTVPNHAGDQIQFTIVLPPIPPGQRGQATCINLMLHVHIAPS